MDTMTVAQNIAESVERELDRVRAARPALASRVDRAANIVATHLSCRRQRVIRVRVSGGVARFLVSGSKGAVYVVDPASWSCTCPDAHRHGKGCKHALACWALARAGGPPTARVGAPPSTASTVTGEQAGCLPDAAYAFTSRRTRNAMRRWSYARNSPTTPALP